MKTYGIEYMDLYKADGIEYYAEVQAESEWSAKRVFWQTVCDNVAFMAIIEK